MVAGEDDAAGTADGNPAGRFEGLGGLVDEHGAEFVAVEQFVASAHEGGGDDAHLAEDVGIDAHLEFNGQFLEAVEPLVEAFAALAPFAPHLAHGASHLPQLGIVGMVGKAVLIGETQHFVIHACGVADAQYRDAAVHQFLADPVHCGVALGAHEHLCLAHERLVDGLDQGCCLARARRAVQHAYILGPQHIVDGTLLTVVEPRKAHRLEGESRSRLMRVEQVAQIGQTGALGARDAVQGVEHDAITRLIKEQLQPHGCVGILQLQGVTLGDGDDHAVTIDKGGGSSEVEVADASGQLQVALGCLGLEEHDGFAVLEVVVDVLVGGASHLDAELVQGVVVGAADAQRVPGITARHLARQPHGLGVQAIGLLLLLIFDLEQVPLLLQ